MRLARVGSLLLTGGLIVGVAACVGLIIGFEPARLPPALLNIAAYKLTFAAAGGLLIAGAMLIRHARRGLNPPSVTQIPVNEMSALSEGTPPLGDIRQAQRARATPIPEKRDR